MAPETGTNDETNGGAPGPVVPSMLAPLYLSQEAFEKATGKAEEAPKFPAIVPGHVANAFTFGGYSLLQWISNVACSWCVFFSAPVARGGSCRLARLLTQAWWGSGPTGATGQGR